MSKPILLASPHMGGEEIKFVNEAFATNWIAPLGKNVDEFENDIKKYLNIKGAVALSSGTAAIHLGLIALGVKENDIVFCSDMTFSASANPIIYQKAIPVFIDSDYETWNMSPIALKKAFEHAKENNCMPKCVIVVDLYGQSANYDAIREICDAYDTPILEDAAEALGATYKNKHCGTFGDIAILSFNGNKIITTSGGGMLLTNDIEVEKEMRFLSTQAREPELHYEHKKLGFNYRLSNISAGIGRGQMIVLDERVKRKREIYHIYKQQLSELPLSMMPEAENCFSTFWLSCLLIDKESDIRYIDILNALKLENIESRPIWKPMHMQPFFSAHAYFNHGDSSVCEDIFARGLCLPSDTKMSDNDVYRICEIIKKVFKGKE